MGSHLPDQSNLPIPRMFVEFAHVYADDIFGEEHEASIRVMRDYLDRESDPNSLVVSAILIDDLHVDHDTLDVTEFIRHILRRGLAPDHVVFEGRLAPVARWIIDQIPGDQLVWDTFRRESKRVLSYLSPRGYRIGLESVSQGQSTYTCALLSAAWSLCRAGVCEFPPGSIARLTEAPTTGDTIVSVLHERYRGVESRVLELIEASGHQDLVDRLKLVFFT